MSVLSNDFFSDDAVTDSSDASSADGDYRPILTIEESDDEEDTASHDYGGDIRSNGSDLIHHSNPSFWRHHVENGISALDMNGDLERGGGGGGEEEEENEVAEREREASISRAFREDESRRNAPLAPENAVRVMEAMRGVSFRGFTPVWAERVPENRWVDHIRRLRSGEPTSQT